MIKNNKMRSLIVVSLALILVMALMPITNPFASSSINFSTVDGSEFTAEYKDKENNTTVEATIKAFSGNYSGESFYAYSVEDDVSNGNLDKAVLGGHLDAAGLHSLIKFGNSMTYQEVNNRAGTNLRDPKEYQGAIQMAVHKLLKERSTKLSFVSVLDDYSIEMDKASNYLISNKPITDGYTQDTKMLTKVDKLLTYHESDSKYDYYGPISFTSNKDITVQANFVGGSSKQLQLVDSKYEEVSGMLAEQNYFMRVLKGANLPSSNLVLTWVGNDTQLVTYGIAPRQIVGVVNQSTTLTEQVPIAPPNGGGIIKVVNRIGDSLGESINGGKFVIKNQNGNIIQEVKIDDNGVAYTSALPLGIYSVENIEAANGFDIDQNSKQVSIQKPDDVKEVVFVAKPRMGKVQVINVDTNNIRLNGGLFELYNSENNSKIKEFEILTSGVTEMDLPDGQYYIKQKVAPVGTALNGQSYYFNITRSNSTPSVTIVNTTGAAANNAIRIEVVDGTTEATIPGGEFQVLDVNNRMVDTITINSSGHGTSRPLVAGSYVVSQTKAYTGYRVSEDKQSTTLTADTYSKTVTVKNFKEGDVAAALGNIRVTVKSGINYIKGAVLQIRQSGREIERIATDNSGVAVSKQLPLGDYQVSQTDTDGKYQINSSVFDVRLSKDKEVSNVYIENYSTGQAQKFGSYVVSVKDKNSSAIIGADVAILDNGKQVLKSSVNSSGELYGSLKAGEYSVIAFVTHNGIYHESQPVKMVIGENKTSKVNFKFDGKRFTSDSDVDDYIPGNSPDGEKDTIGGNDDRNANSELTVRGVDLEGRPVRNLEVIVYKNGEQHSSRSGDEPTFRLADGNYAVSLKKASGVTLNSTDIQVNLMDGSKVVIEYVIDLNNRKANGSVVVSGATQERGEKSISGYVFKDVNQNGVYDSGDELMKDVNVFLHSSDGALLKEYNVGDSSKFLFSGLATREFEVRFQLPNGYRYTTEPAQGGSKDTTSKVNTMGRVTVDLDRVDGTNIIAGYVETLENIQDPNIPTDGAGDSGFTGGDTSTGIDNIINPDDIAIDGGYNDEYADSDNIPEGQVENTEDTTLEGTDTDNLAPNRVTQDSTADTIVRQNVETHNVPKTGDWSSTLPIVSLVGLSSAAFVLKKKKK